MHDIRVEISVCLNILPSPESPSSFFFLNRNNTELILHVYSHFPFLFNVSSRDVDNVLKSKCQDIPDLLHWPERLKQVKGRNAQTFSPQHGWNPKKTFCLLRWRSSRSTEEMTQLFSEADFSSWGLGYILVKSRDIHTFLCKSSLTDREIRLIHLKSLNISISISI